MCVCACVWINECRKRGKKRWRDRKRKLWKKNVIKLGDGNTSVYYNSLLIFHSSKFIKTKKCEDIHMHISKYMCIYMCTHMHIQFIFKPQWVYQKMIPWGVRSICKLHTVIVCAGFAYIFRDTGKSLNKLIHWY